MEDRGPILRLALVGLLGVALALLALWMARRMAPTPSTPGAPSAQDER